MTHQSFIKAKKNNQTRDKYTMKNIYIKKKKRQNPYSMERNKSLIGFCLSVNDGLPKSCDSPPFVSHCWDLFLKVMLFLIYFVLKTCLSLKNIHLRATGCGKSNPATPLGGNTPPPPSDWFQTT